LGSLAAQLITYNLIIFSKDLDFVLAYYVIVGLCAGGRVALGVVYMTEFLPK
jgi:hypothetical protein